MHEFYESCDSDEEEDEETLELPDELDVASWSFLASDESDLEDESEDQRNKNSNKKLTQAQVDTIVGALNKRGTVSKVIETIRVASKEGGARGDTPKYIVEVGAMFTVQFNAVVSPKVCCLTPACYQDGPQAVSCQEVSDEESN